MHCAGLFIRFITIHQITDSPNVDIDRALVDTPSTPDTHDALVIFVYKVLQFVHKPLPDSLKFCVPGIVTGAVYGKQRVHAAIPVAHP